MKIAITGATGFVGSALLNTLAATERYELIALSRSKKQSFPVGVDNHMIGDITSQIDLMQKLQGTNVLIHTAARAHIMNDMATDPLLAFRQVNVTGTLNLAYQAVEAGVRRFIFISSIKVNGEQTQPGQYFTAADIPAPEDPYAISKWEAEQGLQQLSLETGLELVIIRPTLVYGPGVKGNFASMIKLIKKGLPLPLGAVYNKRSFLALDNLLDLIIMCIKHPKAANQVFLAADGEDLSTSDLLRAVAAVLGKPSHLLPIPVGILQVGASLLGKQALAKRLLGSLQVDISKTREELDWAPPISFNEGLKRCMSY